MKHRRLSDARIVTMRREQGAGGKTANVSRKHGDSDAALNQRKARFGGPGGSRARLLRALEVEP